MQQPGHDQVQLDYEQMCAISQRHFTRLFGESGDSTTMANFSLYLDGLPQLWAANPKFIRKPIMVPEIREAMNDCTCRNSLSLGGVSYEFYVFMPDLLDGLLADVCRN